MKARYTFALLAALVLLAVGSVQAQDKLILSEGWYPSAPAVDAKSSDFRFVVEYLRGKLGATEPQLIAERMEGPGPRNSPLAPHVLVFVCPNSGKVVSVDAVLSFIAPEVSLLDLQRSCGLPLNYARYEKPVPPPPTVEQPKLVRLVGEPIPGVPGWYGITPGDNSPDGAFYEDERGRFVKVVVRSPFGNSAYWRKV